MKIGDYVWFDAITLERGRTLFGGIISSQPNYHSLMTIEPFGGYRKVHRFESGLRLMTDEEIFKIRMEA